MSDFNHEHMNILGKLCRIEISEEEMPLLLKDLKRVLDYIELLQEVDVTDIPTYSHLEEYGVDALREDTIKDILPREVFLANAPDQIGGMIRVPSVIKQNP